MIKISRRAISTFICTLIMLIMLAVPAFAVPSDYTITVSTDAENVKYGDVLTVNVTLTGAQFCAVDAELSYDANSFDYVSSMAGWSDDGEGRLRLLTVKGSDGYWQDGKVIGSFKFAVKDTAPAGKATFAIGKDRNVFVIGDWAEGASSEPAKPLEANQLVSAAVTVTSGKSDSKPLTDFGVISDDGNTVNMEAGYHVYSIPDSDDGEVVWESSDESIVTVDEDGLVTAVSDGSAVLTAKDKAGNELEQRTIIVGDMPEEAATADGTTGQTPDEPVSDEPASDEPVSEDDAKHNARPIVIAAVAVVIIVAVAAVVLSKKQKNKA